MTRILTFLLLLVSPIFLIAQTQVTGTITDASSGEGLIGANILIQGTATGTTTDFDGNYSLTIQEDAVLVISYTGYSDQQISVSNDGGTMTKNIALATDALQLQDVVVTANKRSQAAQKVPLSISTLSPEELKRTGSFEATDYFSSIPNLSLSAAGGGGNAGFGDGRSSGRNIAIRGVSGDKTTAMYLDDTPLPEFADPKLFDVERVEVLRGPQGTLYGSSTMGGAVKIITKKPNAFKTEGNIDVSVASVTEGNLDYNVQGVYNIPLATEKSALRVGAFYNFKTGIYDRIRQTNFNGFPLNTGDGTGPNPGAVWDHDEDPGSPDIPWTDGSIPIVLAETGNLQSAGGWGTNETRRDNINDESSYGFNVGLGFYPSERVSIIPKLIYQKTKGDGYDFADFRPDNFEQYRIAGLDESYELDLLHGGITVNFGLGNGTLTNSFSYNQVNQNDIEDVTERESSGPSNTELGGFTPSGDFNDFQQGYWFPEFIERTGELSKIVEELRYISESDSKFNFTAGLFFSSEDIQFDASQERQEYLNGLSGYLKNIVQFAGLPDFVNESLTGLAGFIDNDTGGIWYSQDTDVKTNEFAFFGEAYFDVSEKLTITAGLRYFNASQEYSQLIGGFVGNGVVSNPGKVTDSGVNPKFNITFNASPNSTLYLNAAKGYRLGGANPSVPVVFAGNDLEAIGLDQAPASFESDAIWTYEIGTKNTLANGRMIFNASLFRSDWDNLQQRVFLPSGFLFIDNVGKASMTGVEVELKGKLSKELEINGALGYVDATIEEGSILTGAEDGDRVLNVPELTASAGLQYTKSINADAGIYARLDLQHTGDRVNTFDPRENPQFVFDAFTILNARVGYTTKKYEIALYAKNLTNTIANFGDITSLAATPFGRFRYQTNRPTSIGLNLRYNF